MNTQPQQPGEPITTETPLTISASLGQGSSIPIPPNVCDHPMDGFIWLRMFPIEDTLLNNDIVFKFDSSDIFAGQPNLIIPPNISQLSTAVNQQHSLHLRFMICKLMNAPFSLQSTTRYRAAFTNGLTHTDPTDLYPDIDVRSLDQNVIMDKRITIPFNGIPVKSKYYNTQPDGAVVPRTVWEVRMRNPYVRSNIHPKIFYIHAFVKFDDLNLTGYSLDYVSKNVLLVSATP